MATAPDVVTYNSIVKILAEKVLKQTEQGIVTCKADIVSYAFVLDSYVKGRAKTAATRAIDMLDLVEREYHLNLQASLNSNEHILSGSDCENH